MTLTLQTKNFSNPRQSFDFLKQHDCVNKLFNKLRSFHPLTEHYDNTNRRRRLPLTYFRVLEFTDAQFVHVNVILDAEHIPFTESQVHTLQCLWDKFAPDTPNYEAGRSFGDIDIRFCQTNKSDPERRSEAGRIAAYLTKSTRLNSFPEWVRDLPERSFRMIQPSTTLTTKKNTVRRNRRKHASSETECTVPNKPTRPARTHRQAQAEISQRSECCRVRTINGFTNRRKEYVYTLPITTVRQMTGNYRAGSSFEITQQQHDALHELNAANAGSFRKQVRQQLLLLLTPLTNEHCQLAERLAEEESVACKIKELCRVENYIRAVKSDDRIGEVLALAQTHLLSIVTEALLPHASAIWIRHGEFTGLDELRALTNGEDAMF